MAKRWEFPCTVAGLSYSPSMRQTVLLMLATLVTAAAAAPVLPIAKIEITCNDQMTYNSKAFAVTTGQRVTLTLKNVGKIPLKAMGHNLVLLQPGTSLAAFAGKANAAKKTDFIPDDAESEKAILTHTRLLGGGDSHTIHFYAPAAGAYPFICSSPGHFSVMQGGNDSEARAVVFSPPARDGQIQSMAARSDSTVRSAPWASSSAVE